MRKISVIAMGLLLASCGGGKGCGPTYNASPITVHRDFYYLELGELTPGKIKDGIMVIEATMPDSEKKRLGKFWDDAQATGNISEDTLQFVHMSGYIEHEDHLHKNFVYGSDVYDYSPYICSQVRLFTDNSYFLDFEQGLPFAIGDIRNYVNRKKRYEDGKSSEMDDYHNPSGYATSPVPELGVESDEFYKGNFKVRVEIGTSITEDNIPEGKFFLRLYLRMAIARNYQVSLDLYEPTTPLCGPYAPDVDMTADMPIDDMNYDASDMGQPDIAHDMNDEDESDMAHDMNINDMKTSDVSSDLSMD
jgi:hypothetical protein